MVIGFGRFEPEMNPAETATRCRPAELPSESAPHQVPRTGERAILLEAEGVIAAAKPAGETVVAARGEPPEDCLQKRLERLFCRRLWVVHRIDRHASGLVLFTTNAEAHRALSLAFEHRHVVKTYLAFVSGRLVPPRGRIDIPLHPARKGKTRPAEPDETGQPAATQYRTCKAWTRGGECISLVDVHPLTGRHHQIRVHLRAAGAPIAFDPLYGRGLTSASLGDAPCSRLALHALRLEAPAPSGGGTLRVEAPLAEDLEAFETWLDAWGVPQTAD